MARRQETQFNGKDRNHKITNLLLRFFIPSFQDTKNKEIRTKYGYLEGWISVFINTLLFALKFFFGLLINSISLIADAFHTLADILTSIVVLIGFKIAKKPADTEHPYGHGRFETVATLAIAILLLIAGFEFLKSSLDRYMHVKAVKGSILVVAIMLFSALAKEWLARFSVDLGKRIDSSVLIADAWHHRSDAIASLLVAAAIVAAFFGYYRVDAVFGMIVSVLIIYTGIELGKTSVSFLMGKAPSQDLVAEIEQISCSVEGVVSTHKTSVHDYGGQKAVSLHIQVDKTLSVDKSHAIAASVKYKIAQQLEDTSVEVHVEPCEKEREE